MNPDRTIEAFILAGGASRRMGRDKAQLRLDGFSFTERVAAALASVSDQIRLVGAHHEAGALVLPNVPDLHPGWGALGGVEAALVACETAWAAVAACDLPFVTGALFTRLADRRQDFDAVVPVQQDGRAQPLCALYRPAACAQVAQRLVAAGERRPRALLAEVNTRWVHPDELADLDGAERFFLNINTPEDYALAQAR